MDTLPTTHEERVQALSWAVRQLPLEDRARRRALMDVHTIVTRHHESQRQHPSSQARGKMARTGYRQRGHLRLIVTESSQVP